jgi:hypothetical protein
MQMQKSAVLRRGVVGLLAACGLATGTAQASLYGGPYWVPFDQASVIARFPDPAFSTTDAADLHPSVVYYSFLTDQMLEIDWIGGEDQINGLQVATSDTHPTGAPDGFIGQPFLPAGGGNCFQVNPDGTVNTTAVPCDDPDETDDIADVWLDNRQGLSVDVIPPPEADDAIVPTEDPELFAAYAQAGLTPAKWGDERPVFGHQDAEAIWIWAQQQYGEQIGDGSIGFQDTLPHDVIDEEDQDQIEQAMRQIELVTNVRFAEKVIDPDSTVITQAGPFTPVASAFGQTIINSTDGFEVLSGDASFQPNDDYPWLLITGPRTVGNA